MFSVSVFDLLSLYYFQWVLVFLLIVTFCFYLYLVVRFLHKHDTTMYTHMVFFLIYYQSSQKHCSTRWANIFIFYFIFAAVWSIVISIQIFSTKIINSRHLKQLSFCTVINESLWILKILVCTVSAQHLA